MSVKYERYYHSLTGYSPHREAIMKRQVPKSVVQDRRRRIRVAETLYEDNTGLIETEGAEATWALGQDEISRAVDIGTQRKLLNLDLPGGPFAVRTSRNGRQVLFGGLGGQIAALDRHTMEPLCEVDVREPVRDVAHLQNEDLFAAAQKSFTFIYDSSSGAEVHRLKEQRSASKLEYLPYHQLLVTLTESNDLHYVDVSTGTDVCKLHMRHGHTATMAQNPKNAVIYAGHARGTVSLWTPNSSTAAMKLLCHSGAVTGIAVNANYMATGGVDGTLRTWDLRYVGEEPLRAVTVGGGAVRSVSMSANAMVAAAAGGRTVVWKKSLFHADASRKPYLVHAEDNTEVSSTAFIPFEDLLLCGTSRGINTMLVPGAGAGRLDSTALGANPFETRKQKREHQVRSLLEKLAPETICLDPSKIGSLRED